MAVGVFYPASTSSLTTRDKGINCAALTMGFLGCLLRAQHYLAACGGFAAQAACRRHDSHLTQCSNDLTNTTFYIPLSYYLISRFELQPLPCDIR